MENIEQVIELVAFTEKEVSVLLDCKEEFKSVMFRLNNLRANEALNARFEGLDETEIEQIKASERAEEIIALQEEAAEAYRVRKVSQLISEKVEIEVETANLLTDSIVEPTEPVVETEVEPTEPVVEDEVEPIEPLVDIEVEPTEQKVDIEVEPVKLMVDYEVVKTEIVVEPEASKKIVKKV